MTNFKDFNVLFISQYFELLYSIHPAFLSLNLLFIFLLCSNSYTF